MVKINFTENDEMRIQTTLDGQESNIRHSPLFFIHSFIGFVTRIMGVTWLENEDRFIFLISEGVVIRYVMSMSMDFKDIINRIQLHQIIIVRGSIARFGVPDSFTNNPFIADFRFEINTTSFIELIPITLGTQDFAVLPNIIIEIDCENEE
ncbi:hypothetical protein KQX54_006359 [Cotesia glomerata]|uniref:Uncharacterized protein n=1 Tax=Cotesia glomerata TaxID=32391 RepID=A0AAV7J380_COTGL|nr:hypothetical protein KQX54_006359 [Cotesia glomerata]